LTTLVHMMEVHRYNFSKKMLLKLKNSILNFFSKFRFISLLYFLKHSIFLVFFLTGVSGMIWL
jgi:hypothetical protein